MKEAGRSLLSLELTDQQEEHGTDRDCKGQKHAHGIEEDGEATSVLVRSETTRRLMEWESCLR